MGQVRIAVIGVGGIGMFHAANVARTSNGVLVAACDSDAERAGAAARQFGVPPFTDVQTLLDARIADAVVVATPHFAHADIAIAALRGGLHVLVEKPLSVHVAECRRMIDAHRAPRLIYATMLNQRTDPYYRRIREIVTSGELGDLTRINWTITNWFRTEAYYRSSSWRATWRDEGGGVLLNQCPHNLDLLQWICGMPARVRAFCALGKRHDIEVEDEVTAYLEFPNAATGVFIASTGETPGANRLEICGDRGRIVMENDRILHTRLSVSASRHCRESRDPFAGPASEDAEVTFENHGAQHLGILQNFIDAITRGETLIAPAEEGIHCVELANAMLFSSITGATVELPLDAEAYARMLAKLIETSRGTKTVAPPGAPVNMAGSFGHRR